MRRFTSEILAGLQRVKDRDGVPVSEQVRRALIAWLEDHGVRREAARKRRARPGVR